MNINTTQLKQFELKLSKLKKTGLRIAKEGTLNDIAFETRLQSKKFIEKKFTTRNKFTTSGRNLSVDKAKRGKSFAEMGHKQEYMAKQEDGFQKRPDKFTGAVAIPTPVASGERTGMAVGKTIRKKPVRKPNRRNMLKMASDRLRRLPRRERTRLRQRKL